MTALNVTHDPRTGDIPTLTYNPLHLLGEAIVRLEAQGVLPVHSIPPNPIAARRACEDLLRALGVRPVSPSAAPVAGLPHRVPLSAVAATAVGFDPADLPTVVAA